MTDTAKPQPVRDPHGGSFGLTCDERFVCIYWTVGGDTIRMVDENGEAITHVALPHDQLTADRVNLWAKMLSDSLAATRRSPTHE